MITNIEKAAESMKSAGWWDDLVHKVWGTKYDNRGPSATPKPAATASTSSYRPPSSFKPTPYKPSRFISSAR